MTYSPGDKIMVLSDVPSSHLSYGDYILHIGEIGTVLENDSPDVLVDFPLRKMSPCLIEENDITHVTNDTLIEWLSSILSS